MKNLGRYNNDLSIPRKKDVDGKYTKPADGIPKSDLNASVQSSLDKADSALQAAPVTSVNRKTGAVQLGAADVGALPDTMEIPSKTSDLVNDSGFITDADVPVKSVNGKTGAVKLAAADVGALPNTTKIPTKTSDITNDSGYITADDVPTKVSELDNDAGYITDAALTPYAKTADIPTKTSQLTNDSNFATTSQVNAKYTKPSAGIPKTDLAAGVQDSLDKADSALQSAPVTSVAGKTGAVSLSKTDVALGNVDNVRQYSASNPPPYPVTSVNGQTGAVTVESGTKVTQYTGTLLASSWSEDSYGYQSQTITITGLKASYDVDPEWDVVLSGTDSDADAALLESFALIHNYKTGANSLTAQCIGAAPTINIPVKVVVFG